MLTSITMLCRSGKICVGEIVSWGREIITKPDPSSSKPVKDWNRDGAKIAPSYDAVGVDT